LHKERKIRINDPTNVDVYSGCRFRARCPYVIEKCKDVPPLLEKNDRRFACFVDIN
jgi:peptide/nickel transport system ATP-binding protein